MITKDMPRIDARYLFLLGYPHVLIAGDSRTGKTTILQTILYNLMKSEIGHIFEYYEHSKFYFIDTNRISLMQFIDHPGCDGVTKSVVINGRRIPTSARGYISEPEETAAFLEDDVIHDLDFRYEIMSHWPEEYGKEYDDEYHTFVVIDDLADIIDKKGVLDKLLKIARLGNAAHMHLICCMRDIDNPKFKSKLEPFFNCRVVCQCRNEEDSISLLGIPDAYALPQYGEALVKINHTHCRMKDITPVPDHDITELIRSYSVAHRWLEWMREKPTFRERISGIRERSKDLIINEVMEPLIYERTKGMNFRVKETDIDTKNRTDIYQLEPQELEYKFYL